MRITATIFLCLLGFSSLAQTSTQVRVIDTMADLVARKPVAGETVQVRNKSSTILWSAPRSFTAYSTSTITNAHDGTHFVTNGVSGSIYASADRNSSEQDPRWWGAAAVDGVDNATALQAALDYSANKVLKIPAGVWRFSETLVIPENTTIVGEGSGRNASYTFTTNTTQDQLATLGRTVLFLSAGADVPMMTNSAEGTVVRTGTSAWDGRGTVTQKLANVRIKGVVLDGNASQQTVHNADAIRFVDRWSIFLDDVVFERPSGYFLNLWNCNLVHVFDCGFNGDGTDTKGILLFDTADLIFSGPQMGGGTYGPMLHVATGTSWLNTFSGLHFGDTFAGDISGEIESVTDNVMTLSRDPLVETGDPVMFYHPVGDGFLPTGPTLGQTYFAIRYSPTNYGYSDTLAGAFGLTNAPIVTTGSNTFFGVGPGCGMLLSGGAQFNTVSESRFDNGHRAGVILYDADFNNIQNNLITRPGYNNGGTRLDGAGVWVKSGQSNNISGNIFTWATRGIQVDSGTHIVGPNQFYDVATNWIMGTVNQSPAMAGTDGSLTVAGALISPLKAYGTNVAQVLTIGRKRPASDTNNVLIDQSFYLGVSSYNASDAGTNVFVLQDVTSERRIFAARGNDNGADFIIGEEYGTNAYTHTLRGSDRSGTNLVGSTLRIESGASTGTASGGDIEFLTSDAGSSGTVPRSKTAKLTVLGAGGVVIRNGDGLTIGGVTQTNWPSGLSYADLTNAILPGANVSFAYDTGLETITISSSGGGGGATNGTAITVDSGAFLSTANFADSSRVGFSASGTNITADIVSGSVRTNELDAAALSYLTAWTSLSGVPSFVSDLAGATGSAGTLLYFDGTFLQELALGTSGQVLTVSGSAPAWADPTGGGGSTNGTPVSVDGSLLSAANFSGGSRIGFSASGTNVTADIVAASVRTNELAAAAISYLTAWSSLSGTPTSLSGYGITDAQPLDTDLTRIANVTWASGDFAYRDATGLTNFASTSVGRGLLNAADEVDQLTLLTLIGGTPTDIDSNARVLVRKNSGTDVGTRRRLNFIEGTNTSLTITDDAGNEEIDIIVASTATAGSTNATYTTNYLTVPLFVADTTNEVATGNTTETNILTSIASWGSTNIALGTLPSGTALRFRAGGTFSGPGDWDGGDLRFKVGGLTVTGEFTDADSLTPAAGSPWSFEVDLLVVSAGSSAVVAGSGGLRHYYSSPGSSVSSALQPLTISGTLDTTTNNTVGFTFQNNSGQVITLIRNTATLEHVGKESILGGGSGSAGAAGTKTLASFRAQQGEPPASNYATFSTRNAIGTLLFDHTTSEAIRFRWVVPEGYTNTVADVILKWTTSATSGDGRWGAENMVLTGDIDADSFGTAVEATTTTSGTAGTVMTTTLEDVSLDGAVAGDWVWTEVYRDDLGGADTIDSNDLELHAVEVRAP